MFVDSEESLLKLNRKRKFLHKDTILLLFSSMCGPCHMFLPTWKQFMTTCKNDKNIDTFAIEVSFLSRVKNEQLSNMIKTMSKKNRYVPNIAKYNAKDQKITLFKADRTVEKLKHFSEQK